MMLLEFAVVALFVPFAVAMLFGQFCRVGRSGD
jgi:hypothetical protein